MRPIWLLAITSLLVACERRIADYPIEMGSVFETDAAGNPIIPNR